MRHQHLLLFIEGKLHGAPLQPDEHVVSPLTLPVGPGPVIVVVNVPRPLPTPTRTKLRL